MVYTYIEDEKDTGQRFITSERIDVALGQSTKQKVQSSWRYTDDGRFLLDATVDPVGSTSTSEYNPFNQLISSVDATGHQRHFKYDIQVVPTSAQPHRYDLLQIAEMNVDVHGNNFPIQSTQIYKLYDVVTSIDAADRAQSTHRIASQTDELGNTTTFGYDDQPNSFSLKPTSRTDALGKVTRRTYDAW